eukprot:7954054-Pyramimonas_sp.AAC.1
MCATNRTTATENIPCGSESLLTSNTSNTMHRRVYTRDDGLLLLLQRLRGDTAAPGEPLPFVQRGYILYILGKGALNTPEDVLIVNIVNIRS